MLNENWFAHLQFWISASQLVSNFEQNKCYIVMKSKMNLHTCNFEYLQADQPGHPGGGRAFLFEKEDPCKTLEKGLTTTMHKCWYPLFDCNFFLVQVGRLLYPSFQHWGVPAPPGNEGLCHVPASYPIPSQPNPKMATWTPVHPICVNWHNSWLDE